MAATQTTDNGTLASEHREIVIADLQAQLVELIDLGLLAKQAHWNVVGPNFRPIHQHLDEMVEEYQRFGDDVAERINALDSFPDGQVKDIADGTPFPSLPRGALKDVDVVQALAERLETAIAGARARIERLDDHDLVSQDLLIELVTELEKQRWMLRAQLR